MSQNEQCPVVEERRKKSIAPLVFEEPCQHIPQFGPCLAEVTVYKWKMVSKMATALGFPTETHKLLYVVPIETDGTRHSLFEPMVLELNFGSKALFSSGTYMHCLKCAKFSEQDMLKCSEPFICCIEKDFIIKAEHAYIDTIQFFGPRKCNCQSYAFFLLRSFGVPEDILMKNSVVETDSGFIRSTVKRLAISMENERPTCEGDRYEIVLTEDCPEPISPVPIPSFIEQFELDEYNDDIGKKYKKVFFGLTLTTSFNILLLAIFVYLLLFSKG